MGPRRRRDRLAEELDVAARPGHGQRRRSAPGRPPSRPRCRASTSTCAKAGKSLAKGETPWTPAVGVAVRARRGARADRGRGLRADLRAPRRVRRRGTRRPRGAGLPAVRRPGPRVGHRHRRRWLPDGVEWSALNKELRARGLVLAGGQGWLPGKIFRVGHLGDVERRRRRCARIERRRAKRSAALGMLGRPRSAVIGRCARGGCGRGSDRVDTRWPSPSPSGA